MAISTTDVITPANTSSDNIANGNAIVYCSKKGTVQTLATDSYVSNPTFSGVEAKYTDRFDDVGYYVTPDLIDGNP